MLHIQLADKRKACFVDEHLRNCPKSPHSEQEEVRAQYTFYDYLKKKLLNTSVKECHSNANKY
jgi:polyphosphate kinase